MLWHQWKRSTETMHMCFCLLTGLNMVELEHGSAGPAWTWLLTGLFMHVGTDCSWLDERTDLNNVVGTIVNQQPCSYIIEHVVREWWNNKIEQRCYNNHELGCCIKSGFACSNIHKQPCHIRQAVYNMLKHDWTILLFYQSCSIMLTVLSQSCCMSQQPCKTCDIFQGRTRV